MTEVHGLMEDSHGFMPHGYPRSRDWGLPDFPCKRATCMCNVSGRCIVPSRCSIGEDGKCEGYKLRETRRSDEATDNAE